MNEKIGILTFHRVSNYGAVLQAYALETVLKKLGADCEIIDYQNSVLTEQYNPYSRTYLNPRHPKRFLKNLIMLPHVNQRNYWFKAFRDAHLVISKNRYDENHLPASNVYSKIIVGSDQVWNLSCNGNDTHYFLDFIDKNKCCGYSYAASMSTVSFSNEVRELYRKQLSHFSRISVREYSAEKFLKESLGVEACTSLDPTLLLDRNEWDKLCNNPSDNQKDYVLVFLMRHSNQILERALNYARMKKLKVVYINLYEPFARLGYESIFSMSPQNWLGYIRSAKYVITNSFHATVFSILFEKNFTTYLLDDEGKNERLIQLTNITGLNNRLKKMNESVIENDVNYSEVQDRLQVERKKSLDYLKCIVEEERLDGFVPM